MTRDNSSLDRYPVDLIKFLRANAVRECGQQWLRVTAVLYYVNPALRSAGKVWQLGDKQQDAFAADSDIAFLNHLVGEWLDACLDAGAHEWRCALVNIERDTGVADLRLLYDHDPHVDQWLPHPAQLSDLHDRVVREFAADH